jgi:hypothetical protein
VSWGRGVEMEVVVDVVVVRLEDVMEDCMGWGRG